MPYVKPNGCLSVAGPVFAFAMLLGAFAGCAALDSKLGLGNAATVATETACVGSTAAIRGATVARSLRKSDGTPVMSSDDADRVSAFIAKVSPVCGADMPPTVSTLTATIIESSISGLLSTAHKYGVKTP